MPAKPALLAHVMSVLYRCMIKAVGYVRQSREGGARSVSIDDQTARVRSYADAHGWEVAQLVVDQGVSGGRRERFDRIRAAVAAHKAKAVIVHALDRFGRDAAGVLDALSGFTRKGVELHVVGRGRIETASANGFLVTSVEAVLGEHYRRLVSEKTRHALAFKRCRNERISGRLPYGWSLGGDGKTLIVDPAETEIVHRMRMLRESGSSLRAISAQLAADGCLARSGRPFAPQTVAQIVRNRAVTDSEEVGLGTSNPSEE